MVIFEDKKKISMTTLCCYNKCMVQDVIMHFCRNQKYVSDLINLII